MDCDPVPFDLLVVQAHCALHWVISLISTKVVCQRQQEICPLQECSSTFSHPVFTFPVILEGGHLPALKADGFYSFLDQPEFFTHDSLFQTKNRQITVQKNEFYIFSCFYASHENIEQFRLEETPAQGRADFNLIRLREVKILPQK